MARSRDPLETAPEINTATLETANQATEASKFLRYVNARRINSIIFDHTNGTSTGYAQRLNGSTNEKDGFARSMSVMPGDTVKMEVYVKYVDTNSTNWTSAFNTLMGQIASNTAGVVVDGTSYSTSTSSFPYSGLLNTSGSNGTGPKAYMNWLVFDRNFVFKTGGYVRMSNAAREYGQDVAHEKLSASVPIVDAGYVYVYLSNEELTPVEVYFDDWKVTQVKSPLVQVNAYYPFGMEIAALGYQRESNKKNNYLFNGRSELQEELGLNFYYTHYRIEETDAPRWWQIDPKVDKFYSWDPYNYGFNNPILNNDPNGDCPMCIGAIVGVATDYGFQVASNLIQGKSIGDALTEVDTKSILASAAIGAAGVGLANIAKKGYQAYQTATSVKNSIQAASKVISKAEQLAINKAAGKAAETTVTKGLVAKFGEKSVGSQITARFKDGSKVVFDNVVVKDGKVVLINETKSGAAQFSKQQARFFEQGEAAKFVGDKAKELNILGQKVTNTVKTALNGVVQ